MGSIAFHCWYVLYIIFCVYMQNWELLHCDVVYNSSHPKPSTILHYLFHHRRQKFRIFSKNLLASICFGKCASYQYAGRLPKILAKITFSLIFSEFNLSCFFNQTRKTRETNRNKQYAKILCFLKYIIDKHTYRSTPNEPTKNVAAHPRNKNWWFMLPCREK